jgi:hypothetical protein
MVNTIMLLDNLRSELVRAKSLQITEISKPTFRSFEKA